MTRIIAAYLILINLIALVLYGIDKYRAMRHKWRIPERTLLLVSFIGGSAGALMGMFLFRHKTRHWKFLICNPLFFALHAAMVYWLAT